MELLMQDKPTPPPPNKEQRMMVLTAMLQYREYLAAVPRLGCSRAGKAKSKNRQRLVGALFLDSDYDAANTPKEFQLHFRMNKETFMKIVYGVREYNDYFMCNLDYTGLYEFSLIQKCKAALLCIVYGAPCDTNEDYIRMA
jgi:hypothetical protein